MCVCVVRSCKQRRGGGKRCNWSAKEFRLVYVCVFSKFSKTVVSFRFEISRQVLSYLEGLCKRLPLLFLAYSQQTLKAKNKCPHNVTNYGRKSMRGLGQSNFLVLDIT